MMSFLKKGKEVEIEFSKLFNSNKIIFSSKKDDINGHWDVEIDGYKYDVKGVKKINRNDDFFNEFYHYIELKNVNGKLGWLYGEADYFAFQTFKYFIIVSKVKLQNFIKNNIKKTYVKTPDKSLYCLYKRKDRKDVITMITTIDLCVISSIIKNRNKNDYKIEQSINLETRKKERINNIFK